MPYYDYKCVKCEKDFEYFHGIREMPKIKCPSCGSKKIDKMISWPMGVVFKGSGFYETDYKKKE